MAVKFQSILKLLATGSFSLVMSACYGAPMPYQGVRVTTQDGQPIPDLKLSLQEGNNTVNEVRTDVDGFNGFMIDKPTDNYSILIEDTDGIENLGEFKTMELSLEPVTGHNHKDVVMEEQNS